MVARVGGRRGTVRGGVGTVVRGVAGALGGRTRGLVLGVEVERGDGSLFVVFRLFWDDKVSLTRMSDTERRNIRWRKGCHRRRCRMRRSCRSS